jgi:hypothetical protein
MKAGFWKDCAGRECERVSSFPIGPPNCPINQSTSSDAQAAEAKRNTKQNAIAASP